MRIQLGTYPILSPSRLYGLFGSRRRVLEFIGELSRELLHIKPRYMRINPRTYEFDAYEYDKGVYVIDVKGIKGYVSDGDDLLTSYWWALFLGLLRNLNVGDVVHIGGGVVSLRSSGSVTAGSAYLMYGTGTVSERFTDYSLATRVGSISTSITIGYLGDRTRITLSGVVSATAYELGIEQPLYDTAPGVRTILLGRKTGSWGAGQAVAWHIDFLSPWVRAVGDLMYGIHRNDNVTMVGIDGSSFIARTSADVNAGSVYLVVSGDVVSWSPVLNAISGAFGLTNVYVDVLTVRSLRATYVHGLLSPASDVAVNTIGLYFPVFDISVASRTVCVLVQPLASPITLYAGRNNLIVLRIIAL